MLTIILAFEAAIAYYVSLAERDGEGHIVLTDRVRQEVCDHLHLTQPGWYDHFDMSQVERTIYLRRFDS